MVIPACNPIIQDEEAEGSEFGATLGYKDPVFKNKQKELGVLVNMLRLGYLWNLGMIPSAT